jgi:hypothetical protein
MSLAELKRGAVGLPEQQRRELAAFLLQLGPGKKVPQAEFERRIGMT